MDILDTFPDDVIEIDISHKNINESLDFSRFTKLQYLKCSNNKINVFNHLPCSLLKLICIHCQIDNLNILKDSCPNLIELDCRCNQIKSLDNLPRTLSDER